MVQHILQPEEIESIDHVAIARLRLPERAEIFALRAQRLRQLAAGHPMEAYLALMAEVVEAQHAVAPTLSFPRPAPDDIARARDHRMPLLAAMDQDMLAGWHHGARALFDELGRSRAVPAQVLQALRAGSAEALTAQAQALLGLREGPIDALTAPFLMAALQLHRTVMASQLEEREVPGLDVATVCPVCGTLPVASIVRIGGRYQGLRYLQCGLCATEWHMVRVKCSHCESTEGISYHVAEEHGVEGRVAEGRFSALKAETCDPCHHYRKICYMEKDPLVEPLADDLASLALDVMMADAG